MYYIICTYEMSLVNQSKKMNTNNICNYIYIKYICIYSSSERRDKYIQDALTFQQINDRI